MISVTRFNKLFSPNDVFRFHAHSLYDCIPIMDKLYIFSKLQFRSHIIFHQHNAVANGQLTLLGDRFE